jgi:hypothetical protein
MKSLKFAAALGLMVAGLGVSTGADAQGYDRGHRNYDRHDNRGDHRDWRDGRRGGYGHDRGYNGHDRGRGYGYGGGYGRGYGHGRDCRTTWRHHRRVTVCYR